MVLMPCSKCCKTWRCFTDGTDYVCVAPDETPPAGWTTDGIGHATELDCIANCGVIQCYRNTAEQRMYRCFSSLELDPDQKIWQPTSEQTFGDKEACESECGGRYMCCLPDGTCENTTEIDCAKKGGTFFRGYFSQDCEAYQVDAVCSQSDCENVTCREDGDPDEKCVTYTVSIKATNTTPVGRSEGVLSYTKGSLQGYPLSEPIDPAPFGPKVDAMWPNNSLNWESEVTVGSEEEGELIASISISELWSIINHWNAQQPVKIPGTVPSPEYTGNFNCDVESVLPFRILGCESGALTLWIADYSEISYCNLPDDAGAPIYEYIDPDCTQPGCQSVLVGFDAGGSVPIGRGGFVAIPGVPPVNIGNCEYNNSGSVIQCFPCNGTYTTTTKMRYMFSPSFQPSDETFAFQWWPVGEPNTQGYYLGTSYWIDHEQDWEITITLNEVDCEDQRKASQVKQVGQFMSLRNKAKTGPGTELAALLKTIGIDAKEKGCKCKSHAKRMDREGPQWCRDNIETILGWLQTEAKKRKLPFIKAAAKQVVLLAIRRAEKKP